MTSSHPQDSRLPPKFKGLIQQLLAQRLQAEDPPLEAPDITGDILGAVDRLLGNKNPAKSVAFQKDLLTVASMLFPAIGMGALGGAVGGGTIPEALGGGPPTNPLRELSKFEKGPTQMGPPPWMGQTRMETPSHGTRELPWVQDLFTKDLWRAQPGVGMPLNYDVLRKIGSQAVTEELKDPLLVEPRARLTEPLPKYQKLTPESRFHGAENPISEIIHPSEVPVEKGRLKGQGLYTTNNEVVADQYAGIKKGVVGFGNKPNVEIGMPGSVRYKVHQIQPVRWLNLEKPFPKKLVPKILESLKSGGWTDKEITDLTPKPKETIDEWANRFSLGMPDDITWNFIQAAAEPEGFGGISHTGGKVFGTKKHQVKIYWHPQEQVRMRPIKYSLGHIPEYEDITDPSGNVVTKATGRHMSTAEVPDVAPLTSKAPKPKGVRDPAKTKRLLLGGRPKSWLEKRPKTNELDDLDRDLELLDLLHEEAKKK